MGENGIKRPLTLLIADNSSDECIKLLFFVSMLVIYKKSPNPSSPDFRNAN